MPKKLLILGLGHLARFVCKEAEATQNLEIIGSYRDVKKVEDLEVQKVFFDSKNLESLHNLPRDADIVLLNLPVIENYAELLRRFNDYFHSDTNFIFISSTSVYGSGESDELSPRNGTRRNGVSLIQCEDILTAFQRRNTTIIRPGGLIDEKRNPAKSLALKREISDSQLEINLVHTKDVARFVIHCILNELWSTEFNLVCDYHVTREVFYTEQFKKLNLSIPEWTLGETSSRVVKSSRVAESNFVFQFPKLNF